MSNIITKEKIEKYNQLTSKAFEIAKKSIVRAKQKQAEEILQMVKCYIEDSEHFNKKGDLVNSYGCLNYAHGWLDCGARMKLFDVNDSELFAVG